MEYWSLTYALRFIHFFSFIHYRDLLQAPSLFWVLYSGCCSPVQSVIQQGSRGGKEAAQLKVR